MSADPFLTLNRIHKSFGGVKALNDVSLDVLPGEVHAIVGENGAGKSTLMKIIAGALQPDMGDIFLEGFPIHLTGPRDAVDRGVSIVYQEPVFCPDLTVLENFFIGAPMRSNIGNMNWYQMHQVAAAVLEDMGLSSRVLERPMSDLSIGNQQLVLIARALYRDAKLIILDEPTSILSHAETELLFNTVRRLRSEGRSVLYISHRMHEVFQLSDCITVLRDGQVVGTLPTEGADEEALIRMMSGRSFNRNVYVPRCYDKEKPLLEVKGLSREGLYHDINLKVRPGEILGLYGLVGSGRSEVAMTLFGQLMADRGAIVYDGKEIIPRSPQEAIGFGISYVPEDRRTQGLFLIRSVADNISSALLKRLSWAGCLINKAHEKQLVAQAVDQLAVKTAGTQAPVFSLSGGNQQKVMMGRWLSANPKLLILDEPTRGVDVGTKTELHRLIMNLAQEGVALIVISSDLPEILALADRILVMHEGVATGFLEREEATEDAVLRLALGIAS